MLVLGPSLCSNSSNSISFTRVHSESPPRRVATVEDESSEVSPISLRNHHFNPFHATVELSKGCERMRNPVRCAKQQLKTAYRAYSCEGQTMSEKLSLSISPKIAARTGQTWLTWLTWLTSQDPGRPRSKETILVAQRGTTWHNVAHPNPNSKRNKAVQKSQRYQISKITQNLKQKIYKIRPFPLHLRCICIVAAPNASGDLGRHEICQR